MQCTFVLSSPSKTLSYRLLVFSIFVCYSRSGHENRAVLPWWLKLFWLFLNFWGSQMVLWNVIYWTLFLIESLALHIVHSEHLLTLIGFVEIFIRSFPTVAQICWQSTPMGTCPTTCVKMIPRWTSLRRPWPTEVENKCLKGKLLTGRLDRW